MYNITGRQETVRLYNILPLLYPDRLDLSIRSSAQNFMTGKTLLNQYLFVAVLQDND